MRYCIHCSKLYAKEDNLALRGKRLRERGCCIYLVLTYDFDGFSILLRHFHDNLVGY